MGGCQWVAESTPHPIQYAFRRGESGARTVTGQAVLALTPPPAESFFRSVRFKLSAVNGSSRGRQSVLVPVLVLMLMLMLMMVAEEAQEPRVVQSVLVVVGVSLVAGSPAYLAPSDPPPVPKGPWKTSSSPPYDRRRGGLPQLLRKERDRSRPTPPPYSPPTLPLLSLL